jgi:CcmD family protein
MINPRAIRFLLLVPAVTLVLWWGLFPPELVAQAGQPTGSAQMRHFWHVFAAYAFAWLIILGWIVAIARRLRRVEERLSDR